MNAEDRHMDNATSARQRRRLAAYEILRRLPDGFTLKDARNAFNSPGAPWPDRSPSSRYSGPEIPVGELVEVGALRIEAGENIHGHAINHYYWVRGDHGTSQLG
jgi:hypothetical protein